MSFRKFDQIIWLSNWFEVVDMTSWRQNLTAFLTDISLLEGRMGTDIWETLSLLMCADCSTYCAFFDSFSPFLALFSLLESLLCLVLMERLRAIARSSWSRVDYSIVNDSPVRFITVVHIKNIHWMKKEKNLYLCCSNQCHIAAHNKSSD